MSKILLIDAAKPLRESLQTTLGPKGYEILDAASLETGLEMALAHLPAAIVAQVAAGRLDAGPLQRQLGAWAATALIPVILIADAPAQFALREALKAGDDLLIQPVSAEILILALEACLRQRDALEQRSERTTARLRTILEATSDLAVMVSGPGPPVLAADGAGRSRNLLDAVEALSQRHEKGLLEHEGKPGSMLDDIGIGIYRGTTDSRGRFLHANPAMARMFGYASVPELMATSIADLYENAAEREKFVREVTTHHAVKSRVLRMRRRNGDRFWVAVTAQIRYDAHGGMKWVEGMLQDVTERQQAEESLARERDLLWALMDCIPDQIYFKDTASKFTRINRQQARLLGLASPEEAVGKSDHDFFDHASQTFADEQIVMTSRRPLINKTEFMRTATGEYRWFSSTKAPIVNASGEVVGLVGITRDVHETKEAEEALAQRASSAILTAQVGNALIQTGSLRGILQECAEAIVTRLEGAFARIWTLNETGTFLELQASAGRYTHLDGAHGRIPVGQFKIGLIASKRKPHLTNSVIGDPQVSDQPWAEREGMVAFAGYPLIIGDRLVGVLGLFARHPLSDTIMATLGSIANGIALGIEQKRAELTLRQSEQLFRLITENAADLISVVNRERRRIYQSPSYEKSLGYTALEIRRMPPLATIHPDDRAKIAASIQESFRTGQSQRLEYRALHKDGSCRQIEAASSVAFSPENLPESLVVVARDVTERKQAEAQLEQASRQAGMAEVASSVLHNVGNVLNSVNTSANVIRDRARKSPAGDFAKVAELLEQHRQDLAAFLAGDHRTEQLIGYLKKLAQQLGAEQANLLDELKDLTKNIDHIKDIVSMQQDYAKVSGVIERLKVADLLEDALRMHASALLRHDVQIVREFAPNLPEITVDKHKLLQALVNLVHNAKHACDEAGRPDKQMTVRAYLRDGGIGIDVADNGVGIPAENLTKIFNHGFTTRKNGHGFGLHSGALAAREMGGTLRVRSDGPGRGATFTLELPLQPKEQ